MSPDNNDDTPRELPAFPAVGPPYVRPFTYVADEPIIRQIGDRELYLGNWAAATTAADHSFDSVLSVSQEAYSETTHHHPFADGRDADWSAFERAVNTARDLHRREGSVLITCTAGISRSATVIAVVLAAVEDRAFREALDIVHRVRPHAMPNPPLHELAVIYLAAHA